MPAKRYYFKDLRFRQLRSLVELGQKGGFSKVARNQGLSVPSIWQQVRAMEEDFGVSLVQSIGQKAQLTEEGQLLAELASPLVEDFDRLRDLFADRAKKLSRRLVVASTPSLLMHELRKPLEIYQRKYPDVRISLIDSPSETAVQRLLDAEADLAVVGQLTNNNNSKLIETPITSYPFRLVCPNNHPLLKYQRLRIEHLLNYPLILPGKGTNSSTRVEQIFAERKLSEKLNITLEASTIELLIVYVKSGFGISITAVSPEILAAAQAGDPAYKGLAFRDVGKWFPNENVVLLRRKNKIELPHHTAFRDVLITSAKNAALDK